MAKELSREVNLGAGTVTVVLQDEFGCVSKHTVNITDVEGMSVDQIADKYKQERINRVSAMIPHLETLSTEHAELAAKVKEKRAGQTGNR
jgi:cytochrome c551/c552